MYIGNSPANIGNYQVVDDISSSFNGTTTSFALASASQSITPVKSGQLLVSINGVLQEPDDTGTDGFKVSGSNIVFSAAPASGSTFWGVYQGQNIDIGSPSDGAVTTAKLDPSGLELKHSSSTKLATTSTGIDVTGTVTADGLTVDGVTTLNTTSGALVLNQPTASYNTYIDWKSQGTSAWYQRSLDTDNSMDFYSAAGVGTVMVLTSSGNVGIGDSNPSMPLSVDGSVGGNYVSKFVNTHASDGHGVYIKAGDDQNVDTLVAADVSGNILMKVRSDGNVGIGTSSPIKELQVGDYSGTTGELLLASKSDTHSSIYFGDSDADFYAGYLQYQHTDDSLLIATNKAEAMRIASDGSIWHKEQSNQGDYTSYIGSISNIATGNRYLHVQIDTDSGDMVWIEIEGYDYNPTLISGRSGCYMYGSGSQPYSRAQTGSIVQQWQNSSKKLELVIDTGSTGTSNRWGSMVFRGGTDTINTSSPMSLIQWAWNNTTAQSWT